MKPVAKILELPGIKVAVLIFLISGHLVGARRGIVRFDAHRNPSKLTKSIAKTNRTFR